MFVAKPERRLHDIFDLHVGHAGSELQNDENKTDTAGGVDDAFLYVAVWENVWNGGRGDRRRVSRYTVDYFAYPRGCSTGWVGRGWSGGRVAGWVYTPYSFYWKGQAFSNMGQRFAIVTAVARLYVK
jgi:hypothetical protein